MQKSDFDEYFVLCSEGMFREAYSVLLEILKNDPRWSRVGDLYVWCAEFELLLNDDVCKARELLDRARELGCPHMAPYYAQHGYVLWRSGERDRGIAELERCVELGPTVTHLTNLGKVLTSEGDERAMDVWHRVLEQDPENCSAHTCLGVGAARSGDRGKALLMAKRAERLARVPQDFQEIGQLYHELGEFELAANSYLKAARLGYGAKGPLYASIAACYFSLGQNATGRKYLAWAMKHDSGHAYVKDVYEKSRDLPDSEDIVE